MGDGGGTCVLGIDFYGLSAEDMAYLRLKTCISRRKKHCHQMATHL